MTFRGRPWFLAVLLTITAVASSDLVLKRDDGSASCHNTTWNHLKDLIESRNEVMRQCDPKVNVHEDTNDVAKDLLSPCLCNPRFYETLVRIHDTQVQCSMTISAFASDQTLTVWRKKCGGTVIRVEVVNSGIRLWPSLACLQGAIALSIWFFSW